jgi:hypothetical protein
VDVGPVDRERAFLLSDDHRHFSVHGVFLGKTTQRRGSRVFFRDTTNLVSGCKVLRCIKVQVRRVGHALEYRSCVLYREHPVHTSMHTTKNAPFGSVDRPKGRTSRLKCGRYERLTSISSEFPCRLATVRSSGIRMLISDNNSAYSFACSFRLRHTISSASCIYIVDELCKKQSLTHATEEWKWRWARVCTYTEMVV